MKKVIISGIVLLIIINLAAAVDISENESEEDIVKIDFIDSDNESFHELETSKNKLKAEIEVKDLSFLQKISYITNNIWVNYIWIKE